VTLDAVELAALQRAEEEGEKGEEKGDPEEGDPTDS
jgi:hypothetical protein